MSISIGISGASKWYIEDCIPKSVMVCENRYVISNPTMQNNFWNVFSYCANNNIRQIITIDMWQSSGHLQPTELQLRQTVIKILNALLVYKIDKDMAIFQLDNEPAKHGSNMGLYCWQANVIHDELNGSYDLYVGSDEVSYRDWYSNVVPNCANEGIAFHLQNCALSAQATDDSVNFIANLARAYQKKVTCSEGNYGDPANVNVYNLIKYQINACKRIGALDYCVIFLELKNQSKYQWLSFKYNDVVRSDYYDDYLALIENEKQIYEVDDMKLPVMKVGVKSNAVMWLQEILEVEYGFENTGGYDGIFGAKTKLQVEEYQSNNGLVVDGIVGKQTVADLINNAGDKKSPDWWYRKLVIFMAYEK